MITVDDNNWASTDDDRVGPLLSYRSDGYSFVEAYKKGYWDGWKHLATKTLTSGWRFPAGLTPYVAEKLGHPHIMDKRIVPAASFSSYIPSPVHLSKEQEAAVQIALTSQQGILQAPTGIGKGRIIGEIIRRTGVRALVVCDKKDLMYQLIDEIGRCVGSSRVGYCGDSNWFPRDVTVATVQTLMSSKATSQFLQSFDLVIVDEAHHVTSPSFQNIMTQVNAFYRFGFSATVFKSNNRGVFLNVQAHIGPLVAQVTTSQAVASGRIVPVDIFMMTDIQNRADELNWKTQYVSQIVDNTYRNEAIAKLVGIVEGPTVVLVERVEHGETLATMLKAPFVSGTMSSSKRKMHYQWFKMGLIPTLILGKLGNEALDLPNIDTLILAGGGKAPHLSIQRVGRSMRSSPGKSKSTVFDFMDRGKYVGSHAKTRLRTYRSEPAYSVHEVSVRELGL